MISFTISAIAFDKNVQKVLIEYSCYPFFKYSTITAFFFVTLFDVTNIIDSIHEQESVIGITTT